MSRAGGRGARSRARSRPVGAVLELELGLLDREPGVRGVDRSSRLARRSPPRAGRRRHAPSESDAAGPRAARAPSKPDASRISRRAASFAIPKPPPCRRANAATARSRVAVEQRPQVAAEVGVAEQERARAAPSRSASVSAWPLPRRGSRSTRAPAASARRRSRRASRRRRRSPPRSGNCRAELGDGRPDPRLLVARGDEDRQRFSHSARGSGCDRRQDPVVAVSPTP